MSFSCLKIVAKVSLYECYSEGPGEDSIYLVIPSQPLVLYLFACLHTFDCMCIFLHFVFVHMFCLHVCPAHKSGPGVQGGPGNIEPNQQEAPEPRISDLWDYPSGNPRAQSAFSTIASCSIFAAVYQYLPENRRGAVCQYFVP